MIYDKGINDMPYGWTNKNKKNHKIYRTWKSMVERCYSEKYHEKFPTYIGCNVCAKWLKLSNFVEEFKLIDGYDEDKFLNGELCLDKDIKSNGENKVYSLENCLWVSKSENTKQANKTRDYSNIQGENHFMYGKTGINNPNSIRIAQYNKETHELIKIWNSSHDIERKLEIDSGHIISCCKFWEIDCDKEKWFKTHKNRPRKSTGGFVFKYYEEDDKNE